MTPRETVASAFQFEETSIVPYWIQLDREIEAKLDLHHGSSSWKESIVPYFFGGHYINGEIAEKVIGNNSVIDAFGSVVKHGNIQHVEKYPLGSASLEGYVWPKAESLADWEAVKTKYECEKSSYRACGMAFGLFERGSSIRGMTNLLMDMIDDPDFVDDMMDGYTRLNMQVMDLIADRIPCEAIYGGGDDCDQRGPMMGIERWRRFVKPRLAKLIEHSHLLGKPYIAHMCGNVMPLVEDLLDIELDVLESLQSEAMDIYELKRITQGRMSLIGGLGVQHLLPFGTSEQVAFETRRLMKELGKGGGYVLSSCKPLMKDVPVENAVAFIETAVHENAVRS